SILPTCGSSDGVRSKFGRCAMKLLTFLLLFTPLAESQVPGTPISNTTANLPAQKIGPRDLIAIDVYDSPELTRSVRVGGDGMVRVPMLIQRIQAEGLMPA